MIFEKGRKKGKKERRKKRKCPSYFDHPAKSHFNPCLPTLLFVLSATPSIADIVLTSGSSGHLDHPDIWIIRTSPLHVRVGHRASVSSQPVLYLDKHDALDHGRASSSPPPPTPGIYLACQPGTLVEKMEHTA